MRLANAEEIFADEDFDPTRWVITYAVFVLVFGVFVFGWLVFGTVRLYPRFIKMLVD